ncbi:axin interactor, dorsalization-associated protein-like [Salvelinus fontinalis]|uniref:axin interactor, dorsalization-associated protein-like n=1 Tax=Salvelinus fontinalis TaxID=8038 RepID=UPI0024855DA6|nr:axin interactor, dorsalization-associated protein-like [Salvelinus fontinalis]
MTPAIPASRGKTNRTARRDIALTFDQLEDLSIRLDNLLATQRRPDLCDHLWPQRSHCRPGSLNTKADALSRLYDTEDRTIKPIPIIPAARLVAPVVWEVDNERALRGELRLHSARRVVGTCLLLILTYNKDFAFDVQPVPLRRILAPGEEENLEVEEEEDAATGAGSPESFPNRVPGTLLPRLPSEPRMSLLTIKIDKIGLKDAGKCIDPYMTVSVKDLSGIDLNPVQDTPVATRKEDTYIHFSVDIEIQRHIERLPKGAAIFSEFKHYKPKKGFTSTKCFAFMEMDEIKPGPIVIELYKKPTDFKRKKLQLLTKKPLYLHLHQTLHKD